MSGFPNVEEQLKLIERGTADIFPREELAEKLKHSREKNKPLRVKLGVDPTSKDIHLGHAVPFRKLAHFQQLGHKAVLIIGDYTATVGDPSGRNATRPQLTHSQAMDNAETYISQVGKILDLDKTEIVYNGEWFSKMNFEDVIKLAARMTVARLLERDDFQKRYRDGNPISLHEFLYPLMQGYDSIVVKSDVEIGGTDQTFNLTVGRDFQRDEGMSPQICLTLPILVGTDGTMKMSKSLGNYIGVDEEPEQMYGKCMSIPDNLIKSYYELATEIDLAKVDGMLESGNPMEAKMLLARTIVDMYHENTSTTTPGDEAQEHFEKTVRRKETPDDIPEVTLDSGALKNGKIWIVKLISECGLAPSNSQARRLVSQGAVSLDDETIKDIDAEVGVKDGMVVRAGKRKYARVRI